MISLQVFERQFRAKVAIFLRRLAERGSEVATQAFGRHVTVTATEVSANVWKITASGEAIGFLEFGAGTMTDGSDPFASQVSYDVSPGSWSRSPEGSGEFEKYGRWEFPPGSGKYMTYVAPRHGMQRAYETIIAEVDSIAREVFR